MTNKMVVCHCLRCVTRMTFVMTRDYEGMPGLCVLCRMAPPEIHPNWYNQELFARLDALL
jgi:hypothetical protein